MKYLAAAAILAACSFPAHADGVLTSKEIFNSCSIKAKPPKELGKKPTGSQVVDNVESWLAYHKLDKEIRSCRFYLLGIADGISTFTTLYGVKDCVPDGVSADDLADVYVKYYSNHPEMRHYGGKEVATSAFIEAYTCRFDEKKKDSRS